MMRYMFVGIVSGALMACVSLPVALAKNLESVQDLSEYTAALSIPTIPIPTLSISLDPSFFSSADQTKISSLFSFLTFDNPLRHLHAEIKEKLGIDIPVLLGAIFRGILWVIQWLQAVLAQVLARVG